MISIEGISETSAFFIGIKEKSWCPLERNGEITIRTTLIQKACH